MKTTGHPKKISPLTGPLTKKKKRLWGSEYGNAKKMFFTFYF